MLQCGHVGKSSEVRLCAHLVGQVGQEDVWFYRVLRGQAMRYDCCCRLCKEGFDKNETLQWAQVCWQCAETIDHEHWNLLGWLGEPTIEESPVPFDDTLQSANFPDEINGATALPANFPDEINGATALHPLSLQRVLAFYRGEISIFDSEKFIPIVRVEIPEDTDQNWCGHELTPRFHLSPSGRFAALVNDYGRYGTVFYLENAQQTMKLDRGEYHPETQPFPAAFFINDGRELLVHGADWNRLEISDPKTGELLTPRAAMNYEDKNPHYLDYFHGSLRVSPDYQWIIDDGWAWHPVGMVCVWNLHSWMGNRYESEDGESKRRLNFRDYFWNGPICWIDAGRLAVEGIGHDDELMIRGATIYDAWSGQEISQFAGPSGAFYSDGTRLFSVEGDGLHLWDVERGARTGVLSGFRPQFQIEGALVQIEGNKMRLWNFA